ncbi:MAG TPA: sigma-70 family RNA polymerase sigma factor, partial [Puia sp.]|nr:sigma-70 family RNA polymerase sigma factor [Puia sp.]
VFAEYWLRYLNNAEIRDVKSYLYSWTRHECIRLLTKVSRARALQQDLENLYQSLYDSEPVAQVADFNKIKSAFSKLSPKQRLVLHLYAEKSWRRKRIAAELQLSEFTVKAHLAAARKNLRNYMQVSAA